MTNEEFGEVLLKIRDSDMSYQDKRTSALVAGHIHGFNLTYDSTTFEWKWRKQ